MIPVEFLRLDLANAPRPATSETGTVAKPGQALLDLWNQYCGDLLKPFSDLVRLPNAVNPPIDSLDGALKFGMLLWRAKRTRPDDTPRARELIGPLVMAVVIRDRVLAYIARVEPGAMTTDYLHVRYFAQELHLFAVAFERELEAERARQAEWEFRCQRTEEGLPAIDWCPPTAV